VIYVWRAAALAVLLMGVSGCAKPKYPTFQGIRSSSKDLALSPGNLVSLPDKPGVLFGTVKVTNGPEQFSYLIVFTHSEPRTGQGFRAGGGNYGKRGFTTCNVTDGGKTMQADYEIELDDMGKVAKEQLKIGGQLVDLAAGRLFLIDLTAASPSYKQKNVALSDIKTPVKPSRCGEYRRHYARRFEIRHPEGVLELKFASSLAFSVV